MTKKDRQGQNNERKDVRKDQNCQNLNELDRLAEAFFYVSTPSGVLLFEYLLWPIFQSSIIHYNYKFFKFLHVQGDLL